jgi:hypothetical protein
MRVPSSIIAMVAVLVALSGVVVADASAVSRSEVAAVRATMRKLYLAIYFGPPRAICGMLTRADRQGYARRYGEIVSSPLVPRRLPTVTTTRSSAGPANGARMCRSGYPGCG